MTDRKPPDVSFPDWIERQIRTAEADGAFDGLAGSGRPIPGLGTPRHEQAWVAGYLHREGVDVAPLLPPGLALAKEVETLDERLAGVRSEQQVRRIVIDLNERILAAHARPHTGPPLRVRTVRVDEAVARWAGVRAAIAERETAERAARIAEARAALATDRSQSRPGVTRWFRRSR